MEWWSIVRDSGVKWWADNALRLGASLSFYTAFALSPLLVIVIAVAGVVFGEEQVQRALMEQISNLVSPGKRRSTVHTATYTMCQMETWLYVVVGS
jgi:uncharacterized BrkB/YihY/UPF0761 family membrane protein